MKSSQQIVFPGDLDFSNYVVKFSKSFHYQINSSQICKQKYILVKFLYFQKDVMSSKYL